jgi:hypothetical protein
MKYGLSSALHNRFAAEWPPHLPFHNTCLRITLSRTQCANLMHMDTDKEGCNVAIYATSSTFEHKYISLKSATWRPVWASYGHHMSTTWAIHATRLPNPYHMRCTFSVNIVRIYFVIIMDFVRGCTRSCTTRPVARDTFENRRDPHMGLI